MNLVDLVLKIDMMDSELVEFSGLTHSPKGVCFPGLHVHLFELGPHHHYRGQKDIVKT